MISLAKPSWHPLAALLLALVIVGCAAPARPAGQAGDSLRETSNPRKTKSLTLAITSGVQAMSVMGNTTTAGGWQTMNEIHSNGLVTSDVTSRRPIGRLAERVPSSEDGSVSLLPDGRMRVSFSLRKDVIWQDGRPFTAHDLVFSQALHGDTGLPTSQRETVILMESVQALDDHTFVVNYKGPYYRGATLGLRPFWPLPQHILGEPMARYLATGNPDEVANHHYWTSEYIHLGPFRLTTFDPGEGLVLEAYDGYFLGRAKVDVVRIRVFNDHNTLFASLLGGSVDMIPENAINAELGFQLKERWEATGEGSVQVKRGNTWFLVPQWRANVITEPANHDPKVRAALYHALDREALSEGLQGGPRDLAAWSILPPGDRLYDATKDALRQYSYDADRARSILRDAGWSPGPDGVLRHSSDGRRFRNAFWTVPGRDREIAAFADYWRRVGIEVEELTIPAAQVRNSEFRALYPSWESTAQGSGDALFARLEGPAASAANRWVGERGGYEDPRAQQLIDFYRTRLSEREQFQAMKAISDFVVAELPLLIVFFKPEHLGVRKGVRAYDDVEGGAEASQPYGTYTRNAHLWDVP